MPKFLGKIVGVRVNSLKVTQLVLQVKACQQKSKTRSLIGTFVVMFHDPIQISKNVIPDKNHYDQEGDCTTMMNAYVRSFLISELHDFSLVPTSPVAIV